MIYRSLYTFPLADIIIVVRTGATQVLQEDGWQIQCNNVEVVSGEKGAMRVEGFSFFILMDSG